MAILTENSQQTTCNVVIQGGDGRSTTAGTASSIRPGRGWTVSVDVLESSALTDENRAEVAEKLAEYLTQEAHKAAGLSIPVK